MAWQQLQSRTNAPYLPTKALPSHKKIHTRVQAPHSCLKLILVGTWKPRGSKSSIVSSLNLHLSLSKIFSKVFGLTIILIIGLVEFSGPWNRRWVVPLFANLYQEAATNARLTVGLLGCDFDHINHGRGEEVAPKWLPTSRLQTSPVNVPPSSTLKLVLDMEAYEIVGECCDWMTQMFKPN